MVRRNMKKCNITVSEYHNINVMQQVAMRVRESGKESHASEI